MKRSKFTTEEDALLKTAVEVHGTDWVKVALAIPGRTNTQCRGRYMHLTGDNPEDSWDAEDDMRPRAAINMHGPQRDQVHEEMRTIRDQRQVSSIKRK